MKSEYKAAVKAAAPFGLVGAGVLAVVGNPAAWAVLAYSTYRLGRVAYEREKNRARLHLGDRHDDLFI